MFGQITFDEYIFFGSCFSSVFGPLATSTASFKTYGLQSSFEPSEWKTHSTIS
jgi:hypothetical protein